MKEVFKGIYQQDKRLYTINSVKDFRPFGEQLITKDKKQFRFWDANRSKAAAAVLKGIKEFPIKKNSIILYLGIAHGYTASFLSNIIGEKGIIYGIEFSDRCFNELLPITEKYKNITPFCEDARKPENFSWIEKVDIVYCDIAQPDQTEIAIRNCKQFLKEKGFLMLAIKTQSIDVTKSSKDVVKAEIDKLKKAGFKIIDWKMLDPYEEKHGFVIAQI